MNKLNRVKINNIQTLIISPTVVKKLEVSYFLDDALYSNDGFNSSSNIVFSDYEKKLNVLKEDNLVDCPYTVNEKSKLVISYPFDLYQPNTEPYTHFF